MLSIKAKLKDKEGLMQLIDQSMNKFADNYEAVLQTTRHAREINEISLSLEIGLKGLSLWPNDESLVILSAKNYLGLGQLEEASRISEA